MLKRGKKFCSRKKIFSRKTMFTADEPHIHPIATEHGYVLEGSIKSRCYGGTSNERIDEMEFHKGNYFLIRPGVLHVSKNASGTRILFIKSFGINDKTVAEEDEETKNGWHIGSQLVKGGAVSLTGRGSPENTAPGS